jgi:LysM repeat protein
VAFAFPGHSVAFWPFSSTAAAQGTATPILTDSTLPLLSAATNPDPNPSKGQRGLAMTEGSALISEAGPEGTPPDVNTIPVNSTISLYTVREGDTLSGIAELYGISTNTILWANNLKSATDIHPGDALLILPVTGIQHVVKKGETLASLAKSYGGDAADIAAFNGLASSASLAAGSTLIIPGGELSVATPSTPVKSSSGTKSSGSGTAGLTKGSGPTLAGYFGNPIPGGYITQGIHPTNGVDIGMPIGTPIHASAAGTVIVSRVGGWNGGYGNYVVISHSNGTQTLYGHMSRDIVTVGQSVAKGEVIGYVGETGNATGPHLHFEVRGATNPLGSCAVRTKCYAASN